jgi:hypothetical protein
MTYRLTDRPTEDELVRWMDRQAEFGNDLWQWFGGIAVGVICTLVVMWSVGAF